MDEREKEIEEIKTTWEALLRYTKPPKVLLQIFEVPLEITTGISKIVRDIILEPARIDRDLGKLIQNIEDFPEYLADYVLDLPYDFLRSIDPESLKGLLEAYTEGLAEIEQLPWRQRREMIEDITDLIELIPEVIELIPVVE